MRRRNLAGTLALSAACALGAAPGAAADEMSDYTAVRGDFQPDRVLTACRFTVEQLEGAKSAMTGEDEYSGLQGAIGSEIIRHRTGGCPGGGGLEGTPVVSRVRFARGALRFGLSRRASVRVVLERRRGARWARTGTLVRTNRRAGESSLALRLAPGRWRATVTAVAGGRRSAAKRALFTVRR